MINPTMVLRLVSASHLTLREVETMVPEDPVTTSFHKPADDWPLKPLTNFLLKTIFRPNLRLATVFVSP